MISEKIRKYELIVVFNPNTQGKITEERISKTEEIVKKHKGEILKKDLWGKRSLAYPIKNFKFGSFVVLTFSSEGSVVSEINRSLNISDEVLRHTIVIKDKYSPDLEERLTNDFTYGYRPQQNQFSYGSDDDDNNDSDDSKSSSARA